MTAPRAPFEDWTPLYTDEDAGFHVWYDAATVTVITQTVGADGDVRLIRAYIAAHEELRVLIADDIERAGGLHNVIDMRSLTSYQAQARGELTRWMKGRDKAETRRADIAAHLNPILRIGMETVAAVAGAFGAYRPRFHTSLHRVLSDAGLSAPPTRDERLRDALLKALANRDDRSGDTA